MESDEIRRMEASSRAAKLEHENKKNLFSDLWSKRLTQCKEEKNSLLFSRLLKCYLVVRSERPLVEARSLAVRF